jgi:hypothetical protein
MTLAPLSPARSADTPAQDCDEATASDAGAYQTCLKLLREELEALVIEAETWVVIVARRLDKADNGLRTNRIGDLFSIFASMSAPACSSSMRRALARPPSATSNCYGNGWIS